MEPRTPPPACDHCGTPSPSLLRCVRCKSAWYCDRTCQERAWWEGESDGGGRREGHKAACRRLRKQLANANGGDGRAAAASSAASNGEDWKAREAMAELLEHVAAMDRGEAYRRMCRAEDEVRRLEAQMARAEIAQRSQPDVLADRPSTERQMENAREESMAAPAATENGTARSDHEGHSGNNRQNGKEPRPATDAKCAAANEEVMKAKGSWLDRGGRCSIEYLPNVSCYQITLAAAEGDPGTTMPRSKDDLQFDVEQVGCLDAAQSTSAAYFVATLRRREGDADAILSAVLPARYKDSSPFGLSCRLSIDASSISLRVQMQSDTNNPWDGSELADVLTGMEGSSFTPNTTSSSQLNRLRCRSCRNPIVDPPEGENGDGVIRSVLPLPTGYWDDITDYLVCYDGQANVDFTSSSTSAMSGTALEDDAALVLHRADLMEGSVRITGSTGYGEHSSERQNGSANGANDGGSLAWKDKSAAKGEGVRAVTCSKCCSTLGFVSDHDDATTYRMYKHLLDCGTPSAFAHHTCGSFLAREMVRYAESEAVYTFIVGVSDENDWTRVHAPGEFILIRMLSWDTPLAILGGEHAMGKNNHRGNNDTPKGTSIRFRKVVKAIFEVTSGRNELAYASDNDDPLVWSWRGNDFCCPPLSGLVTDGSLNADDRLDMVPRKKASSTRIFFSQREWSELREALATGASYFSKGVSDAVASTKLGPPADDRGQAAASLSFLPLVT